MFHSIQKGQDESWWKTKRERRRQNEKSLERGTAGERERVGEGGKGRGGERDRGRVRQSGGWRERGQPTEYDHGALCGHDERANSHLLDEHPNGQLMPPVSRRTGQRLGQESLELSPGWRAHHSAGLCSATTRASTLCCVLMKMIACRLHRRGRCRCRCVRAHDRAGGVLVVVMISLLRHLLAHFAHHVLAKVIFGFLNHGLCASGKKRASMSFKLNTCTHVIRLCDRL